MVVYIDIVFLLAFFQDFGLLVAAGLCMKEKINLCRIILGGMLGAFYQIICIFCSLSSVFLSIVAAFLQVTIAYNCNRIKITGMYITGAMLTAGIMYAVQSTYIGLMFIFCVILLPWVVSRIRNSILLSKLNAHLKIKAGEGEISVKGFIDSGNSLKITVIGKSHAVRLLGKEKTEAMLSFKEGNYSTIPCITIKGYALLPVFTADLVTVNGKSFNNKIGVMRENLPYALLPVEFLETGDMDDKENNTEAKTVVPEENFLYRWKSGIACTAQQRR